MAIQGLDTDGDGVYSKEELAAARQGQCRVAQRIRLFHLRASQARTINRCRSRSRSTIRSITTRRVLTLAFHPAARDAARSPRSKTVAVDVYDPSFFVAFGFATDAPVKIAGTRRQGLQRRKFEKPDPENEADAKALSEAFFSQLGPNSNFGSQFAQTVIGQMLGLAPDPRGLRLHRCLVAGPRVAHCRSDAFGRRAEA